MIKNPIYNIFAPTHSYRGGGTDDFAVHVTSSARYNWFFTNKTFWGMRIVLKRIKKN